MSCQAPWLASSGSLVRAGARSLNRFGKGPSPAAVSSVLESGGARHQSIRTLLRGGPLLCAVVGVRVMARGPFEPPLKKGKTEAAPPANILVQFQSDTGETVGAPTLFGTVSVQCFWAVHVKAIPRAI